MVDPVSIEHLKGPCVRHERFGGSIEYFGRHGITAVSSAAKSENHTHLVAARGVAQFARHGLDQRDATAMEVVATR